MNDWVQGEGWEWREGGGEESKGEKGGELPFCTMKGKILSVTLSRIEDHCPKCSEKNSLFHKVASWSARIVWPRKGHC